MNARRAERVAEALREELAEIIGYEMADPRLEAVCVVGVEVSRDLRRAQVRVTAAGDAERQREAMRALEGARHWIRRQMAGRIRLWRIPEFHFRAVSGQEQEPGLDELGRNGQAGTE